MHYAYDHFTEKYFTQIMHKSLIFNNCFVYLLFFKMCIWLLCRRWKKKENNTIREKMDTICLIK